MHERTPPEPVARALWAGAAAGVLVGALDAAASWARLGQFAPGIGARLGTLVHVAGLYGAAGALVAAAAAATSALFAKTALGPLLRHAARRHREARAREPREALTGLSLVLAGVPALAGALALAHAVGTETLARRHHQGLIVAVVIAATLGALVAAALVALVAGAVLERLLRAVARGSAARVLSHPAAPAVAALFLVTLFGGAAAYATRKILAQLALRPYVVAVAWAAAAGVAFAAARRPLSALARLPANRRLAAHAGLVAGALFVGFGAAGDAARKGAAAHTGLGGLLSAAIRAACDLDRDGHSPVLGGGDCDDLDPEVHPGAADLPDDGVDQNCLGGDVRLARRAEDVRFVPLPESVPRDANVLFITIDTIRADHVGAYGYARPTTPALDALAAEGTLFSNAWAHAPSTRYSIPAILTGRYPSQVLWDTSVWWPALRAENRTIAEVLKDRGFTTGAILNYHYFDRVRRMDQGFDTYDNTNARLHQGRDPASTRGTSSREQADAAIRWIEAHADRRFFLWVHFYDPHFEYELHPGTVSFGDDKIARYDHEIRFTDDQLARVFARLRELGLWDKTIVAVTGDHGEGFGEHGIDFHGYHLYPPQTKVPLVVRVPGLAPRRVSMPVGHIDLLPTLANLVGAPPEPTMLGRSLVAEMAGRADADADRVVFQEVSYEGPTERRAAVTRRWQLVFNRTPDNTWELYDLAAPGGTERDVWGRFDVKPLKDALLAWIDASQYPPGASEVIARARLSARPSPRAPSGAELGKAVRLLGVDLPAEARAGEEIEATWYFESLRRLDGDWIVFAHFDRAGGGGHFRGDHPPVEGALPAKAWRPGQLIADRHRLRIPPGTPPGDYVLFTGLWTRARGNLPVTDGAPEAANGRVRAAVVRVLP